MDKSTMLITAGLGTVVGAVRLADFMNNANTALAIGCVGVFLVICGLTMKCEL